MINENRIFIHKLYTVTVFYMMGQDFINLFLQKIMFIYM